MNASIHIHRTLQLYARHKARGWRLERVKVKTTLGR